MKTDFCWLDPCPASLQNANNIILQIKHQSEETGKQLTEMQSESENGIASALWKQVDIKNGN